ncbi:membrane transporter [Thozetella sp. PMI_491]|nr:membrane transporter [Thozetella sp. PMI_491]
MTTSTHEKAAVEPKSAEESSGRLSHSYGAAELEPAVDEALKKRVLRKTDFIILPMMCFVFFFQYLDKQSLAYAAVYGLITDLELVGTQFSWTSSFFYVGQLAAEFPFIYLMSRLRLSRFVGITIVIWGVACMCLAAPKTYGQFLVARFFLGVTEGAVSPAFITITSIWYKKSEHPMRIACWISCNGIASTLGSLLMYAIGENNSWAVAKWKVLFLIAGGLTSALGVVFFFLMPDNPQDAWFFTPEERLAAAARLAEGHEGGDKTDFSRAQLKESVFDFNSYAAFLFGLLVTAPAPVLTFASLMIQRLGYTPAQTLLYNSPAGAVQIVAIWLGVAGCLVLPRNRCIVVIGLILIPIVGCIMLLTLPFQGWPIIAGSWLGGTGSSIFTITMSLNASNVKGNTKKSIVNTLYFIGYCTGSIAFPQLWSSTDAPRYIRGLICSLTAWSAFIVLMVVYWFVAARRNRQRERFAQDAPIHEYQPGADVTDFEDKTFRYQT